MLYDAFTGDLAVSDVARIILSDLSDEFGVIDDLASAQAAVEGFINEVQADDTSWGDLAGHAADLGSIVISYFPQARVANVIANIYGNASLL